METELCFFLAQIAKVQESLMAVKLEISTMPFIRKVEFGMGVTRILNSECVHLAIGLEVDYNVRHDINYLSLGATIIFEFHPKAIILLREVVYTDDDVRNEKLFGSEDKFQSLNDLLSVLEERLMDYNLNVVNAVRFTAKKYF